MRFRPLSAQSRGFSLIELIVVMGIIVIVATFAVPAASSTLRGSQVSQAASMLADQLGIARQQALSRNRKIEVRFLRFGDPEQPGESATDPTTGKFRAIQLMEINELNTAVPLAGSKIERLPNAVMLNEDMFSSVLDSEVRSSDVVKAMDNPQDPELPRGVARNYEYVAFRFRPDGSTDGLNYKGDDGSGSNSSTNSKASHVGWFLTVHLANDLAKLKSKNDIGKVNFYTIQIDPVTGLTRGYHPTAG